MAARRNQEQSKSTVAEILCCAEERERERERERECVCVCVRKKERKKDILTSSKAKFGP